MITRRKRSNPSAIIEALEARVMLDGSPISSLTMQRLLVDDYRGGYSEKLEYCLNIAAADMTDLTAKMPWGDNFDAADYLPDNWAGEDVNPVPANGLTFSAGTTNDGDPFIQVVWTDLSPTAWAQVDAGIDQTSLEVTFAQADPWDASVDFSPAPLPWYGQAPGLESPSIDQVDVQRDPTVTWDAWDNADGTGQIDWSLTENGSWTAAYGGNLDDSATSFPQSTLLKGSTKYDLSISFVQPGDATLDGVESVDIASATQIITNFTTETSNPATISKFTVSRLDAHDLTGGGDTETFSYHMYVSGPDLTDVIVTTPWGDTNDVLDYLPPDWADGFSNDDGTLQAGTVEGGTDHYFSMTWSSVTDDGSWSAVDTTGADVVVRATDGVSRGTIGLSSAAQPSTSPAVTNVVSGAYQVDPNVTFAWNPWAGTGISSHIGYDLETDPAEDGTPVTGTLVGSATSMKPTVSLLGGESYTFALSFYNTGTDSVGGVTIQTQSATSSTIDFTVLASVVISGVEANRGVVQKADQSGSTYEYALGVWGNDLNGFSGLTPWGASFNSANFLPDDWSGDDVDDAIQLGALTVEFQAYANDAGMEQFEFTWTGLTIVQWNTLGNTSASLVAKSPDGPDWTGSVNFTYSALPQQAPQVTSFTPFAGAVDPNLDVAWNAWTNAPAAGRIYTSVGYALGGDALASGDLDGTATEWQPDGGVDADDVYELHVQFANPASTVTNGVATSLNSFKQATLDFGTFGIDNVHLIGTVPAGSGKAQAKNWSYPEDDGDAVTPAMTGKGYAQFLFDSDGALKYISLVGGDATSKLSLGVVADSGGDSDGVADVGGVINGGSAIFGTLDLSKAALGETGIRLRSGVKTLNLLDVFDETPLFLSGSPSDKVTVTARRLGQGVKLDLVGTLDKLSVATWASGSIDALGLNTLTVSGSIGPDFEGNPNDFGPDLNIGAGGIKQITVTGGDFYSLINSQGSVDKITVTAVAPWDPDALEATPRGGNLLSAFIQAASTTKGKPALGNVTLTGGSFGSSDAPVDLRGITAGDIGNIVIKTLTYKSGMTDLLDKNGDPVTKSNGDTKQVAVYSTQGGGIFADIDTTGKVGNLTTAGGDLYGTIHAKNGIGAILLQAATQGAKALTQISGINYVTSEDNMIAGNLVADLKAETATGSVAIKSITVVGGDISSNVEVTGKIGPVSVKAVAVMDSDITSAEFIGGNFTSSTFTASGIGNVSVTAGDFNATLEADAIGNIAVVAGGFNATVKANKSLGNVSAKAVVVNAVVKVAKIDGEWQETQNVAGMCIGDSMNLIIQLGGEDGSAINTHATWGTITGTGVDVSVGGTIPWDPTTPAMLAALKQKITSKKLKYTPAAYLEDSSSSKITKDEAITVGGDDPDWTGLAKATSSGAHH